MNGFPWLSFITFTPLLGAVLIAVLPKTRREAPRQTAIFFSLLALLFVLVVLIGFERGNGGLQRIERHSWIPSIGVDYFLGVDGLGLLMVLLSALVVPFAIVATSRDVESPKACYALLLFLQAGLFGTFTALNFFHWFIFWELSLVPAYFLIKLWGGPHRRAAATQFFIYTLVGSVALLLAFQALYLATETFDFVKLAELGRSGRLPAMLKENLGWQGISAGGLGMLIFSGALLGFAVKVPLVPFHTWLPAAYAEAPSSTTMVLTGALSKMGVYGFLRILVPIFPAQMRQMLTVLLWLAVATVVLSAFAAFAQKDLKRMIAYSSVNHLGYCLLGIFATMKMGGEGPNWAVEQSAALNGVILQMFNHGLTAAALFCFIGYLERRSGGMRGLNEFGGLRRVAPVFCGLMGIALFASLGLPGLSGFVGEFLIFKGVFSLATWAAAFSVLGLLATAIFMLTILQRVFHGPLNVRWSGFPDLTWTERLVVLPAVVLIFLLGIFPQMAIGLFNSNVVSLVKGL